uniref:NADH-ubiquinone oxidoreductase chain 2 n=1 Tax=Cucujoidea sp. 1 KM-2017 TaxID=2219345 RepID=A0A346RJE4_9CUCU|nr:NADH dehydrogenase subunit 2 [Cucujoidea sp. 1 KM-2017]
MKFYKILFLNTLILGTLISISAYSWLAMWLGLEINLLSFIPLMSSSNSYSTESSLKYFIIQALSSMMILFTIILNLYFSILFFNYLIYLMNSALLMKMGCAPFHFWFVEIISGMNWSNAFILLTWQKIAPMILLMYSSMTNLFLNFVIFISLLISGINSWNQTLVKKILALSSINHMSWMLSILFLNHSIWLFYFLVYFFISLCLILMFKNLNITYLSQISSYCTFNKNLKLLFFCNFLSLSGLPPFLGFFPKWLVLSTLLNKNFMFLSLMLIFFTLIMIYIYLMFMFNSLVLKIEEPKMFLIFNEKKILHTSVFLNLSGLTLFTIFFSYF